MKKSEYTRAIEYAEELIAFYQVAGREYREASLEAETYDERKNFDNQADGCDGVINRLEHVRAVIIDAQRRTGAHWATRVTA